VRLKILHLADLHLGVESYGRIDPVTGLSSRLLDFLAVFDQVVDYALENKVDLVLFCGDAYKSREPTPTQQREFARRINRLASNGVAVFLLVGNHDLPTAIGKATTTEIFDTLAIKNVYVSSRPDIYRIQTKSGPIQVASLPWPRRGLLLSKEETKNLDFNQIKQKLEAALTRIISVHASQLAPSLPAILAAHVWVTGAKAGSEKMITIGQDHALLPGNVANPAFDYIALGHIHKHQVLSSNPPMVYAGSLERLDFSEEADEKGFYMVEIEPDKEAGKRRVSFAFHPVKARRFLTINVDVAPGDTDPTATVLRAIARQAEKVKGAIVRLQLSLPEETPISSGRDSDLRDALKEAYYVTIAREIKQAARLRLGNWTAEELTPLDALKTYLDTKKISPDRAKVLLEYARGLLDDAK
jgi:exonuclease SbcD